MAENTRKFDVNFTRERFKFNIQILQTIKVSSFEKRVFKLKKRRTMRETLIWSLFALMSRLIRSCDSCSNESRNASVAILQYDVASKDEPLVADSLLSSKTASGFYSFPSIKYAFFFFFLFFIFFYIAILKSSFYFCSKSRLPMLPVVDARRHRPEDHRLRSSTTFSAYQRYLQQK